MREAGETPTQTLSWHRHVKLDAQGSTRAETPCQQNGNENICKTVAGAVTPQCAWESWGTCTWPSAPGTQHSWQLIPMHRLLLGRLETLDPGCQPWELFHICLGTVVISAQNRAC